jgi:periplasmic protein TonB
MKSTLLPLLTAFITLGHAQDTLWIDKEGEETTIATAFHKCHILTYLSADSLMVLKREYTKNFLLQEETPYSNYKKRIVHGNLKSWHENGQIKNDFHYQDDLLHGTVNSYYENGSPRRLTRYEKGVKVEGDCFNEKGKKVKYYEPTTEAIYKGGVEELIKYLSANLQYPIDCIEMNIQGRVFLSFVVEKDGSISNIKVIKSAFKSLDEEAVRVVSKMKKWTPGTIDGQAVRTRCRLPVNFTLN